MSNRLNLTVVAAVVVVVVGVPLTIITIIIANVGKQ